MIKARRAEKRRCRRAASPATATAEKECDVKLPAYFPVPVRLMEGDQHATEINLAENIVRAPMHPADVFEAFRTVIDGGAWVADVAGRFDVSEDLVEKRLKLGRLSPVILAA